MIHIDKLIDIHNLDIKDIYTYNIEWLGLRGSNISYNLGTVEYRQEGKNFTGLVYYKRGGVDQTYFIVTIINGRITHKKEVLNLPATNPLGQALYD